MNYRAKSTWLAILLLPSALAALPAFSQDIAANLGKQRAAASRLEWEVGDAGHPLLGNVRFATLRNPVETQVGNAKIYSRVYLSCQKDIRKLAIELANATAPDDPKGLKPNAQPRLVCSRPITAWDEKVVQEELLANFEVSGIGDALARNFRAFPLRECASIRIVQDVALPAGWVKKSVAVEFDITPYSRELDAVFVACGEVSAYGSGGAVVASAPAQAPAPAAPPPPNKLAGAVVPAAPPTKLGAPPPSPVAPPKLPNASAPLPAKPVPAAPVPAPAPAPAQSADNSWQTARVPSSGKTNVRATPNLQGAIVAQLDPGAVVLVQKTGNEWWKAKPTSGAGFEGYIRQDRLVFK